MLQTYIKVYQKYFFKVYFKPLDFVSSRRRFKRAHFYWFLLRSCSAANYSLNRSECWASQHTNIKGDYKKIVHVNVFIFECLLFIVTVFCSANVSMNRTTDTKIYVLFIAYIFSFYFNTFYLFIKIKLRFWMFIKVHHIGYHDGPLNNFPLVYPAIAE